MSTGSRSSGEWGQPEPDRDHVGGVEADDAEALESVETHSQLGLVAGQSDLLGERLGVTGGADAAGVTVCGRARWRSVR
jgi:hypothetical protein